MRVLSPGGVAMIGGKIITKPVPETIDQWTHYLHDADNNAVAHDSVVGPPRHYQWTSTPEWSRAHLVLPSIQGLVSAKGRRFGVFLKPTEPEKESWIRWGGNRSNEESPS